MTKITHQGAGCNELSMIGGGVDRNTTSLVVSADVTRTYNCISSGSLAVDGKDTCGLYEERRSGKAWVQTDSSKQLDLDCSCISAATLQQHEKCQKLFTPGWPYDGIFPRGIKMQYSKTGWFGLLVFLSCPFMVMLIPTAVTISAYVQKA